MWLRGKGSGSLCGRMKVPHPALATPDEAAPSDTAKHPGRNVMSVAPPDPAGEDNSAPIEDRLRAAYAALRILGRQIRTMRGES